MGIDHGPLLVVELSVVSLSRPIVPTYSGGSVRASIPVTRWVMDALVVDAKGTHKGCPYTTHARLYERERRRRAVWRLVGSPREGRMLKRGLGGGWRIWRAWLLIGLISTLAALGQGRAHARTFTSLPVTHCDASSLQQVVTCVEGSVLLLDVSTSSTESRGTGFVIQNDATGTYVLTNKHVAEGGTPGNMTATSPDG